MYRPRGSALIAADAPAFAAPAAPPASRANPQFAADPHGLTARFRALLSRHLSIDPQHVHAYVVGEHGDSEVLLWSLVGVGGIPINDYLSARELEITLADKATIDEQVRRAAYHIIEGKKATYYGVGAALARICEVILNNQRAILTICAPHHEVVGVKDVTIALPHLISGEGVIDSLPLTLAESNPLRWW